MHTVYSVSIDKISDPPPTTAVARADTPEGPWRWAGPATDEAHYIGLSRVYTSNFDAFVPRESTNSKNLGPIAHSMACIKAWATWQPNHNQHVFSDVFCANLTRWSVPFNAALGLLPLPLISRLYFGNSTRIKINQSKGGDSLTLMHVAILVAVPDVLSHVSMTGEVSYNDGETWETAGEAVWLSKFDSYRNDEIGLGLGCSDSDPVSNTTFQRFHFGLEDRRQIANSTSSVCLRAWVQNDGERSPVDMKQGLIITMSLLYYLFTTDSSSSVTVVLTLNSRCEWKDSLTKSPEGTS